MSGAAPIRRDFRPGGFSTIAEALDYAADGSTGITFNSGQGVPEVSMTYGELRALAREFATGLIAAGFRPFDRLALIAKSDAQFLAAFYGCQYASIVPCPMPYRTFVGAKDVYREQIGRMVADGGIRGIIAPTPLAPVLDQLSERLLTYEAIPRMADERALRPFAPDDPAYVQYSSGSTSEPRGVLVTQKMVTANVTGILVEGLRLTPEDRAFSWLPFYHDMGLVGFSIAPMSGQCGVDYISPSAFARRPTLWLKLMSELGSTITYSPSFGYELAARRYPSEQSVLDLSKLRVCGIGGDMIRPEALDAFARAVEPAGFSDTAFLPSYGMAESTLAISFAEPGRPYAAHSVDGRRFVVCGRPLPSHDLAVTDDEGVPVPEGAVGHIQIRGPSVMTNYVNRQADTDRQAHAYLDTGDLGYIVDGAIVVTGRHKDLMLHNGRNIWPQDIEWAVERAPSVTGAAAFAIDEDAGAVRIVVLIETPLREPAARQQVSLQAQAAVLESVGVSCDYVLVPPNTLPYTSSGKLSRAAAKRIYQSGTIERRV